MHVALWSDESVQALEGKPPRFPEQERAYLLGSLRFVDRVTLIRGSIEPDTLPDLGAVKPDLWIVEQEQDSTGQASMRCGTWGSVPGRNKCGISGISRASVLAADLRPARKRVIVTGCYDWFHSGHVRFFEEASALGDLYVVVGHDVNIALLKGAGHPLLPQDERLYMVHSVCYVHQALISTGHGWLDAEPEIALVKPHFYVVNEDGDKPEKRAFCGEHGIEYVVLKRIPKAGLPRRESTDLRGF